MREEDQRSDRRSRPPARVHPHTSKVILWKCGTCGYILAKTTENMKVLRMKYRDFYAEAEGGRLTAKCRNCGTDNTVGQAPSRHKEEVFSLMGEIMEKVENQEKDKMEKIILLLNEVM